MRSKFLLLIAISTAGNVQTRTGTEAKLNAPIGEKQFAIPVEGATAK